MGVTDEIRGLLAQGKTSSEIIALGHAPGTVYRLQRELRRRADGTAGAAHAEPGNGQDASGDRPLTAKTFAHWYERHLMPDLLHLAVHAIDAETAALVSLAHSDNEELRQAALKGLDRLKEHRKEHLQEARASLCPPQSELARPAGQDL